MIWYDMVFIYSAFWLIEDTKRLRGKKEDKGDERGDRKTTSYFGKRRVLRLFLKGTRLVMLLFIAGRLLTKMLSHYMNKTKITKWDIVSNLVWLGHSFMIKPKIWLNLTLPDPKSNKQAYLLSYAQSVIDDVINQINIVCALYCAKRVAGSRGKPWVDLAWHTRSGGRALARMWQFLLGFGPLLSSSLKHLFRCRVEKWKTS